MGKYESLTTHLKEQRTSRLHMTFAEIERVIGSKLPLSAVSHRAWWSNNAANNVMTKAWLDAGFQSEQVDLPGRRLTFRRVEDMGHNQAGHSFAAADKRGLFGWMRGTVGIGDGVDLTAAADPGWGRRVVHE